MSTFAQPEMCVCVLTSRRKDADGACPSLLTMSNDVIIDDLVARRRVHIRDVICSSGRQRHLFTSAGSRVRIHVTGNAVQRGRTFLIHFEGRNDVLKLKLCKPLKPMTSHGRFSSADKNTSRNV